MDTTKIAYDPSTKLYMIHTKGYDKILWNGKEIVDPLTGSRMGKFSTPEKPKLIQKITSQRSLTGYTNGKETIAADEYRQRLNDCTSGWDADGEPEFESIEDQVRYGVIFESFKPVMETTSVVSDIEFEIIEYPVSEYPEIVPFYQMGTGDIYSTKCVYTPDLKKVIKAYLAAFDVDVQYSKSGLEFMKINGRYIKDNREIKRLSVKYTGTYEECISRMHNSFNRIKEILDTTIALTSPQKLDPVTIGMLSTQLDNVKTTLNRVDPKQKSYSDFSNAQKMIADIQKMLAQKSKK